MAEKPWRQRSELRPADVDNVDVKASEGMQATQDQPGTPPKMEFDRMSGLPEANAEIREFFLRWLEVFSSFVRDVDYASAKPLFDKDILAFGTHRDVLPSLEAWVNTQWDNVWPKTDDFRFDLSATHVLASGDGSMAVVIAPWTSTGFHTDGTRFDRPGRATMVFHKRDGVWLGVHSHLSLNRGVPQTSHGNRPVKAR